MPYARNADLPPAIRSALPPAGQTEWRHIANNAEQQYGDDPARVAATAWAAMKAHGWEKDADTGKWHKVSKMDESLYTTLLKQDASKRYTLGIVYEPLEVDTQGDFAKADTIEQAAWQFMRLLQGGKTLTKWSRTLLDAIVKAVGEGQGIRLDVTGMVEDVTKAAHALGDQHSSWDAGLGEVVECYCMPCDAVLDGQSVKKGAWMLGVLWSPAYFAKIQAGERTGYSMGGKGKRRWIEDMTHAA